MPLQHPPPLTNSNTPSPSEKIMDPRMKFLFKGDPDMQKVVSVHIIPIF